MTAMVAGLSAPPLLSFGPAGFCTLSDPVARSALQELFSRLDDPKGFYADVGLRLRDGATDRFREQNGPDGTPWAPLKPATIKAREREGQTPITILRSNSRGKSGSGLAGSLGAEASAEEVRIGSPLAYTISKTAGSRQKRTELLISRGVRMG